MQRPLLRSRMVPWLGGGLAAMVWLVPGCQHRPSLPAWPKITFAIPYPDGIPLFGPPPVIFTFDPNQPPDLSGVNQDFFFPANPEKILVADDAYRAGLFDPQNHRFLPSRTRRNPSPDGQHSLEIHHLRSSAGTPQNVLRLTDAADTVLQNRWSPGTFTGVFWSPNGMRYGFNERHPDKGDRRAMQLFERDSGDEINVELRLIAASAFFTPEQLELQSSITLRHWLSPNQCVVWVHGPFDGPLLTPQWGYEALVDLSVPAPAANARLLRAFVRRAPRRFAPDASASPRLRVWRRTC